MRLHLPLAFVLVLLSFVPAASASHVCPETEILFADGVGPVFGCVAVGESTVGRGPTFVVPPGLCTPAPEVRVLGERVTPEFVCVPAVLVPGVLAPVPYAGACASAEAIGRGVCVDTCVVSAATALVSCAPRGVPTFLP